MVFLRWLSSWFLISKRNTQLHRKETLDLAIHSSFLKAPHDRRCLRVNQVLSRELKVKSPPWLPPPHQHVLEGNAFIGQWASNIKKIWHDKLKADMTSALTDSPRARLTDSTTLLQHPPPLGIDMEAPPQSPWRVSSGTELDNETNQDSKPAMFFLTTVTRNLAIARFLCESVLVRFEVCFQKFGWIYSIRYFPMELGLSRFCSATF